MSSDKVSFKLEGTFLCGGPSSRALNPANHTWIGDRDQGGGGLERVGGTVGGFLGEGTNPWCRSRSSLLLRSLSPPRPSLVHLDLPSAPPVSSCPWDAALSLESRQCEVEPWSGGISLLPHLPRTCTTGRPRRRGREEGSGD